jgi:hypothetical protein
MRAKEAGEAAFRQGILNVRWPEPLGKRLWRSGISEFCFRAFAQTRRKSFLVNRL